MTQDKPQFRLGKVGRWTVKTATFVKKHLGLKVPHAFVAAVANRSWQMRLGFGPWVPIRIDSAGKLIA